MSKLFASWVPGYATVAQDMGNPPLNWQGRTYTDINGHREGFGATFYLQGNRADWFHIPLPTPVIVEDQRASLSRVMVLFRLPEGAALNRVHVWDGPNRILRRDGLNITGDHTGGLDADNSFDVNHDNILWGVGISLLISCVVDSNVFFASAGGDFRHNI
jgi:Family of unknown function (DUF6623)